MKVSVVVVGRAVRAYRDLIGEYENRASRYWKLEVEEIAIGRGRSAEEGVRAEEERIQSILRPDSRTVALTRKGAPWTSEQVASFLNDLALGGRFGATFVIGGAYGLSSGFVGSADRTMSLSPMTLPHDLARLMLMEQLYRAGTIRRGEPYHKGR